MLLRIDYGLTMTETNIENNKILRICRGLTLKLNFHAISSGSSREIINIILIRRKGYLS